MDDLSRSTFFDDRILSFISKIIFHYSDISAISDYEIRLLSRKSEIIALNKVLDGKLLDTLRNSKSFVTVPDALTFLLIAASRDKADEAKDVLELAVSEEKTLNRVSLVKVLRESENIPMSWALSLIGDNAEDRYSSSNNTSKSSIDIERLREFK